MSSRKSFRDRLSFIRRRKLVVESLEQRQLLAFNFLPVNINNTAVNVGSDPAELTEGATGIYFSAQDGVNANRDLFFHNGNTVTPEASPNFVKIGNTDVNPVELMRVGTSIYFTNSAKDQLYRVTGTGNAVQMTTTGMSNITNLTAFGNDLYFTEGTGITMTLRRIVGSGTAASAALVTGEINRGVAVGQPDAVGPLVTIPAGTFAGVYYSISTNGTTYALGKYNGTSAISSVAVFSNEENHLRRLTAVHLGSNNYRIYFAADSSFNLYAYDPALDTVAALNTAAAFLSFGGTSQVESIVPAGTRVYYSNAAKQLWSIANNTNSGSNGTQIGTFSTSNGTPVSLLTAAGTRVYFRAADELHTVSGTTLTQLTTGVSSPVAPTELRAVGSLLYFQGRDTKAPVVSVGRELWVSDGTVAGTNQIFDYENPTTVGSSLAADSLPSNIGVLTSGVSRPYMAASGRRLTDPANTRQLAGNEFWVAQDAFLQLTFSASGLTVEDIGTNLNDTINASIGLNSASAPSLILTVTNADNSFITHNVNLNPQLPAGVEFTNLNRTVAIPLSTIGSNSATPNQIVTINLGSGNDTLNITGAIPFGLTIDGQTGTDVVNVTGAPGLTLGSGDDTGNLSITAETINSSVAVSTVAGTNPGTVTYIGNAQQISAAVNAGTAAVTLRPQTSNPINLGDTGVAAGALRLSDAELGFITTSNLTIGDAANTTTITFLGGIDLTDGPVIPTLNLITSTNIVDNNATGNDITVATLNMTAPTGIGTLANPMEIAVSTLSTNSSGSNGNQFITEFDSLNLNSINAGTGTFRMTGGTFNYNGANDRIADPTSIALSGGATLAMGTNTDTVAGINLVSGTITGSAANQLTSTSTILTESGSISAGLAGSVGLNKTTGGTVTLSGNNGYTGVTDIQGGVLTATHNNSLGTTAGGTTIGSAGTLRFGASVTTAEPITSNGGTIVNDAGFTTVLSGAITLSTAATTIASGGTGSLTLSGQISGAQGFNLSSGTLIVSNNSNNFAGNVQINGTSILQLEASNGLGTTAGNTSIASGATLRLNNGSGMTVSEPITTAGTINNSAGTNVLSAAITLSGSSVWDVDTGTTLNVTGAIGGGANSLTKTDAGTLRLSGVNTYSGLTTVNGGTLINNGTIAGSVTTTSGTTLAGGLGATAAVISGSVTVPSGATLAPGDSGTGIINIGGGLTVAGSLQWEVNGPATTAGTHFDQLNVTGAVNLNGATLSFTGINGNTVAGTQLVRLIGNDTSSDLTTIIGTTPADNSIVTIDGKDYKLFYNGGDGNDTYLVENSTPTVTYVDDAWVALTPGTFIDTGGTFSDADLGTTGTQAAIFGLSAFAAITPALAALRHPGSNPPSNPESGTVIVNSGIYDEAINLLGTRVMEITGPDVAGSVTIRSLTGAATSQVIIEGSSTLTIGNAANASSTFPGNISGASGSLVKAGTGTLTLSGTNNYGPTTINAGTLNISGATTTTSVAIGNGGTLNLSSGSAIVTGATVSIAAGGSLTGSAGTVNAAVSGAASSTISVTGNMSMGNGGATGFSTAGSVSVSNATLTINDSNGADLGSTTTLSSGTISSANGVSQSAGTLSGSGSVAGAFTGGAGLTITAGGTLSIGNASSASGFSHAGTLVVGSNMVTLLDSDSAMVGSSTTVAGGSLTAVNGITLGTGTLSGHGTVNAPVNATGGTILANTTGQTLTIGNGSANGLSGGQITVSPGATATISDSNGSTIQTSAIEGTLNAASGITVNASNTLSGGGTINGNVSGSGTFSPGASGGTSVGVLTINGNFTPTGTVSFQVNPPATTAGTHYDQVVVIGTVDLSGATLSFTGSAGSVAATQLVTLIDNDAADATSASANPAQGSTVTINGNSYRIFYNGGDGNNVVLVENSVPAVVYVDDSFTGNPGQVIADADLGTNGAQSAIFQVNAFTTIAAALAASTASASVIVNSGTYAEAVSLAGTRTLEITGPDVAGAVTISSLSTVAGTTVVLEGASALTIGDATNTTIAGIISGSGSLTKIGAGTVTLSGANTYTGATNINAGVLEVTGAINSPSATITIGGSGTLSGTGTVTGSVTGSGTVSPGTSGGSGIGILTISGTYTPTATGNVNITVNSPGVTAGTNFDRLVVSGGVNLSGANLNITGNAGAPINIPVEIITNGSGSATNPAANLPQGAVVTIAGQGSFSISYTAGTGNDVVLANTAPTIISNGGGATAQINFAENSTANVTDVDATDPESPPQTLTYSIIGGADSNKFSIVAATGVLTFLTPPNFEAPTDVGADNNYEVIVQVIDSSSATDTQTITVTVTDVDEFDATVPIDVDPANNEVNENVSNGTTVGVTAFSQDADGTTNAITYTLVTNPGNRFAIHPTTGVVTVAAAIDREVTGPTQTIRVRATSADTSFAEADFVISINDIDEFDVTIPVDNDAATNQVNENSPNGTTVGITAFSIDADATNNTITYSLVTNPGGRFAIGSSSGVVTVAAAIDREVTGPTQTIRVRATSADGSIAEQDFVININDVDEFDATIPVDIDTSANQVDENVATGTTVGITAFSTDADATNNTISYTLVTNPGNRFAINATSGVVTVAAAIDREVTGPTQTIRVRATSADTSFAEQDFVISINDLDEFDVTVPVDNNTAANEVPENSPNGTTVGITAFSIDADATNNTITYSLTNSAGGRFAINATSGVVTVANGTLLNFEANSSHVITVQASSSDGSVASASFTINILDVAEIPYSATVLSDNPGGYWRLGESSGTSALDFSVQANHGTYVGSVTLGQAGAIVGSPNTAANFSTNGSRVNVPDAAALRGTQISLELFALTSSPQEFDSLLMKTSSVDWNDGYGLYYSGGSVHFFLNHYTNTVSATLPLGQYTHIVATYDGANMRLFFNGALAPGALSSKPYSTAINHSLSPLVIGGAPGSTAYSFNGRLDEVAVYGTALSSATIMNHYVQSQRDHTDPTPPTPTISSTASSPTNLALIPITVNFGEPVIGFVLSDINISGGTGTNFQTSNNQVYTFNIDPVDGTVTVSIPANVAIDSGDNGNLASSTFSIISERFNPTVLSFTRHNPLTENTSADSLVFLATFSEPVVNVDTADFAVNSTSTATVTAVTQVTSSTYHVTVSGGNLPSFEGTVGLNLAATPTIQDNYANPLVNQEPPIDQTYNVSQVVLTYPGVVLADSPAGYWRLGESSGTTAADSSGNNRHGTYSNNPTLGQPGALLGSANTAANFTPSGSRVTVPDDAALRGAQISLETFVFGIAPQDYDGVILKTSNNGWGDGYGIYYFAGSLHFFVNNYTNTVSSPLTLNQYTHVVATYDGSHMRLYYNGSLAPGALSSKPYSIAINHSLSPLLIGFGPDANAFSFNGRLDEVAVYPSALTAAKIANHYNVSQQSNPDTTPPTPVITSTASSPTNLALIPISVDFGEPVTGFVLGDIVVSGGTPSNLQTTNNQVFTFQISPVDGTVTVDIPAGVAADLADNPNLASAQFSIVSERFNPSVTSFTRFSPASPTTSADSLIFTATFSEAVTGVDVADFAVNSTSTATVTNVLQVSSSVYRVTVSGGNLPSFEGTVGLNLAASPTIVDLANKPLINAEPTIDEIYTVTQTVLLYDAAVLANAPSGYWRLGESSGTVASDSSGNGLHGTYSNGPVLGQPGALLGSPNKAASFTTPGARVTVNDAASLKGAQISIESFVFGVNPQNYDVVLIKTSTGDWGDGYGIYYLGGSLHFFVNSYTNTVSAPLTLGQYVHVVATYDGAHMRLYYNGAIAPGANSSKPYTTPINHSNNSLFIGYGPSSNAFSFDGRLDEVAVYASALSAAAVNTHFLAADEPPMPIISTTASNPTALASIPYSVDFHEVVVGFTASDLVVTGGTVSGFNTSNNQVFTFNVEPSGDGPISVSIPAGAAADGANNPNQASNVLDLVSERFNPSTVSFERFNPTTEVTSLDVLVFKATFSEPVFGVGIGDFAVNSLSTATVTAVTALSPSTYSVTVSGGNLPTFFGTVNLNLHPSVTIVDAFNKPLPATEPSIDQTYTLVQPYHQTVLASSPAAYWRLGESSGTTAADTSGNNRTGTYENGALLGQPGGLVGSADTAVNFSSSNAQVLISDHASLRPSQLSLELLARPVAPINYDSLLAKTSNGNWSDGYGLYYLSGNVHFFINDYTNTVFAPLPTGQYSHVVATYDGTTMRLFINGVIPSSGSPTKSYSTPINHTTNPLLIGNAPGSAAYSFGGVIDEVSLYGTALSAAAINEHYVASQTNGDPTPPNPVISTSSSSPTSAASIPYSVDFGEVVFGFVSGDITVVNGTVSNFSTTNDQVFTFDILPTGDGTVSVSLAAGVATDGSGNGNLAAGPVSVVSERFNPSTVSFTRHNPTSATTSADVLVFLATFSEPVTGVDVADFAVNSTSTATVTGVNMVTNKTYEVTVSGGDLPSFNGTVGLNFAAVVTIVDLFNKPLPNTEPAIDQIYNVQQGITYQSAVLSNTPAAYWRLGETSGTTAADSSGNARTGTYENGVTLGVAGGLVGDTNTAANFAASSSRVSVADHASLRPNNLSLELLVRVNGAAAYDSLLMKTSNSNWNDGYGLYYLNGKIHFFLNDYTNTVSANIADGSYVHVVARYDGSTMRLYFNGQLAPGSQSSKSYSTPINHSTGVLMIGSGPGGPGLSFNGDLDEVAVYGSALSDEDILYHYNVANGNP